MKIHIEKRKALTGSKTKQKINSKVNSARQKCSSLAPYCGIALAKERKEKTTSLTPRDRSEIRREKREIKEIRAQRESK